MNWSFTGITLTTLFLGLGAGLAKGLARNLGKAFLKEWVIPDFRRVPGQPPRY